MKVQPPREACHRLLTAVGVAQNCNVVLSDSTGATLKSYASAGKTPCLLQVENDGSIEVIDSQNVVWSVNGVPAG